jgi:predicted O-methyltransferase YrrM
MFNPSGDLDDGLHFRAHGANDPGRSRGTPAWHDGSFVTPCDPRRWELVGRASRDDAAGVPTSIVRPRLSWGAGAMRPEGLVEICNDVMVNDRRRVVELGSGMSTVLLARLLTQRRPRGGWRLASVEHDASWAQRVTDQLDRENISRHVSVIHAPLAPHDVAAAHLLWYDDVAVAAGLDAMLRGDLVDLLVVDGPPAHAAGHGLARYPALPVLQHRLAPGATVVLDDIDRRGEQEVVRRWERKFGLSFERLPEPAGVAIATISSTNPPDEDR